MNYVVALLGLCFVSMSYAEDISINGRSYGVEQLGAKYFVYAKHREASARDVSKLTKTNCANLEAELEKKKEHFESCLDDPQSSYCRLTRNSIVLMSQEEHFQSPPLPYSAARRWALWTERIPDSQEVLKQAVAKQFSIAVDKIEIAEPQRSKPMSPLSITSQPNAMLSTIGPIAPMAAGILARPELKGTELVVNNRFFACDFEQGRVTLGASFVATLTNDESYRPEVIESLWNLYVELSALTQNDHYKTATILLKAAMIGEKVGVTLSSTRIDDPRVTLSSIFQTWFIASADIVELKPFSSASEFKNALYPNRTFSKDVEISWSSL